MASIYARKKILQIKYKGNDGDWVRKSTGLTDTPKNRKMVRDELIPALNSALVEKKNTIKVELFEKYAADYLKSIDHHKTYWEYAARVKKIVAYFKDRDIREIQVSELRIWLDSFTELSPKTVSMYKSNCKSIFDMAIENEVMDKNPFVHIISRRSNMIVKDAIFPFSQEEVLALLGKAKEDLKIYLAIAFFAGMRAGEILGLQLSDIDLNNKIIYIKRGLSKGRISTPKTLTSIRSVPILDALIPYLKMQIQNSRVAKSLWLFQNKGKHLRGIENIRGTKGRGSWSRLLESVDMEYRPIKNTRHTFIVAMLKSQVLSMLEIAQIVGHTDTTMIMKHYAKYIEGEQLKINREFNPFERVHTHGHTLGHTAKLHF